MTITVLVCGADGTQTTEVREVPEDYVPTPASEPETSEESGET